MAVNVKVVDTKSEVGFSVCHRFSIIMGRNKELRNTVAHPRDLKAALPYFSTWIEGVKSSSGNFMTTKILHSKYKSFVDARSEDTSIRKLASMSRFSRQFQLAAISRQFKKRTSPQRGYEVTVRVSLRAKKDKTALTDKVRAFCDNPPSPAIVSSKFIDRNISHGVFASKDLVADTVITEYIGENITLETAAKREIEYAREGLAPRMITFQSFGCSFDGYRHADGTFCPSDQNMGGLLNHSCKQANCRAIRQEIDGRVRVFMVTKQHVSCGEEMLWDYNDKRDGLESWLYQ